MVGQFLLGGSQYGARDYMFAVLIVGGTALLSCGSKPVGHSAAATAADTSSDTGSTGSSTTPMGLVFLLVSLALDGVTAGLQKRLLQHSALSGRPTTFDFVLYTSFAMFAVSATISVAFTTDFTTGTLFLQQNPVVARMVGWAILCSAVGQSFIYYTIATFDPFVCSTITTSRKILSVMWSVGTKGHQLSNQGNVGLGLAMSALLMEVHGKTTGGSSKVNNSHHHQRRHHYMESLTASSTTSKDSV
jgi:solute carrier family 35 (UDP-galactose transporter), member B1